MVQLRRLLPRLAVGLLATGLLLVQVPPAGATAPPPVKTPAPENVQTAPGARMHRPDSLPASEVAIAQHVHTASPNATVTAADSVPPFLTRPYWGPHNVTSIFDHCNPDYSHDGRICDVDGNVALSSNGVDPTFTAGYAMTPGGTDYLYYDGHNGWDLGLDYENLMAAAPGIVQIAGTDPYNPGFGLTVTIDHQNGFTTRYAHMSQIWVSSGQAVTRGQAIGVSGNTGASTGPHLHFGLYLTNPWTAIDPWGWAGGTSDPWPSDAGDKWITGNPQNPVPWAPTAVNAVAGPGSAQVSWTAPAFDGGDGISQYTVTANPGGAAMTVPGTATSATLTGLADYTSYTFTVTASNSVGTSPASAQSNAVTPVPAFPGRYHPLTPARVLDTRNGTGNLPTLGPNQTVTLRLAGAGGLPATGMTAVALNLTAVNAAAPGYLTVFPGQALPVASSLNYGPVAPVAQLVESGVNADGSVSIYNGSASPVDVVADVQGWWSDAASAGPDGHYVAIAPARLLDTRNGTGGSSTPLGGGATLNLAVAGHGGVPAAGAEGVVVNVTVTNATQASYVSVFPSGQRQGQVSTVNFAAGQTIANRAFVMTAGGAIGIYNSQGSADVIVDVEGYYTAGSNTTVSAGVFTGLAAPARVLDTRTTGSSFGPGWQTLQLAGMPGIPAMSAGTPPRAVLLTLTETNASTPSYLYVDPTGAAVHASDVNFVPGVNSSNLVVATLGTDGAVHIYNAQGQVDVIVDVVGWYS